MQSVPRGGEMGLYSAGENRYNASRRRETLRRLSGCGAAGSAGALGASGRRFEPCHSDHAAASFISLAATFLASPCAHSAAPPLQIGPAALGSDLVLVILRVRYEHTNQQTAASRLLFVMKPPSVRANEERRRFMDEILQTHAHRAAAEYFSAAAFPVSPQALSLR